MRRLAALPSKPTIKAKTHAKTMLAGAPVAPSRAASATRSASRQVKRAAQTRRKTVPIKHVQSDEDFAREALAVFDQVADRWGLTIPHRLTLLGKDPSRKSTYHAWRKALQDHASTLRFGPDLLDRIAYVVGIYEDGTRLWGSPDRLLTWLTLPNRHPVFSDATPLSLMLRGHMDDLRLTSGLLADAAEGVYL